MEEQTPQGKIEGMTRIVLRPLASPLPLAFFAFGAGSLMLSGLQLGLIPASETRSLAIVQMAFLFPPHNAPHWRRFGIVSLALAALASAAVAVLS